MHVFVTKLPKLSRKVKETVKVHAFRAANCFFLGNPRKVKD